IRCLEADALVAFASGVGVFVRTADCVPLLIADPASGAALAVHAGWRGAVADIVGQTLAVFLSATGASAASLLAAIGPHIGPKAFEVGTEVAEAFQKATPEGSPPFLRARGARYLADLGGLVRAQLLRAGLAEGHIDLLDHCTYEDAARFFSYRRDGGRTGRQLSGIVAREPR
ncbi:MAG: peptidoglycan editing factor PgeF, partial [Sandaracinaceae bacterium]|nr:peptidoglycan editing factor PgeF [Sandaracinaceae bacterium]